MPPTHAELVAQLMRIVEIRLLDPLEILLDGDAGGPGDASRPGDDVGGAVRERLRGRVGHWARQMTSNDDRAAVAAVMRIMFMLYPSDGPFEPPVDWWSSPMGQVLAYRVGHPIAESVSYPVAGAMLGITRQGVHDLVSRGKLSRHPQGGVVAASVRARLLQLQEGIR